MAGYQKNSGSQNRVQTIDLKKGYSNDEPVQCTVHM